MNLTNFRFDTDPDGIALATWDMPGRSMNVITPEVIDELSRIVETVAGDEAIKGCVIASGKESFSGGADLTVLQGLARPLRDARGREGSRGGDGGLLRGLALLEPALPAARDLRKALRRRDPRRLPRRRLRARPRLPPSRGLRRRDDAGRPAGDQGRPVPGRRRHAARGAPDADRRRPADAPQGRADPPADGPQHGPPARGRAAGGDRGEGQGLHPGRRLRGRALGPEGFPAALEQGPLRPGHADLAGRQRHLPARDGRQLPGRQSHPPGRLRGPAAADGPRAHASSPATSPRSCARRRRRR